MPDRFLSLLLLRYLVLTGAFFLIFPSFALAAEAPGGQNEAGKHRAEDNPAPKDQPAQTEYLPKIEGPSDEGQQAIGTFKLPEGFKIELFAAEPMLANPVALSVDEQGRVYIVETFRITRGGEDNRGHMQWLDDDLAAKTVQDRLVYFKKHLGPAIANYTTDHERVRLLEDTDADGRADRSTVFADGFNDILDGVAAGVLAYKGDVFFTCIPNLWKLRDENADGRADRRQSLHYGYGVHTALMGHDLHGLIVGPDGRLYFSIGDRGHHLELGDRTLTNVESGTVFRCNLDGSNLEEVATGLRNPQELAFDDYGNLFTADNNSDSGDKARWVYILDGSESGWRMSYQYFADRGPFNRERLWEPHFAGQAAYIVPPIGNLSDGPAGLFSYPGVGLPEKYRGYFFLADFRGTPVISGVRAVKIRPKGSSFEVLESEPFLWSVLVTDLDFGPDGAIYVSDWVEGWGGLGKGRVYKLFDPALVDDPAVLEVKRLLGEGLAKQSKEQLLKLLEHADRRVRQEAQFELVKREAFGELAKVAREGTHQLARIHAIWGLGQYIRATGKPDRLSLVEGPLLSDADPEIRAQTIKMLSEAGPHSGIAFIQFLKDESPRVRLFAAMALSKTSMFCDAPFNGIVELLRTNDDKDPYIRHAAVMALASKDVSEKRLASIAADPSPAVRMGALLAARRRKMQLVEQFLGDEDPLIVLEAARAIHDVPIEPAMPQLAALINRSHRGDEQQRDALLRRVLNANFRLGEASHAAVLANFTASDSAASDTLRIEALEMLADWGKPSNRDRVMGLWRPLEPRDAKVSADSLRGVASGLFTHSDAVQQAAVRILGKIGIREVGPQLRALAADPARSTPLRVAALEVLAEFEDEHLRAAVDAALTDAQPEVRATGRKLLAQLRPAEALPVLREALEKGEVVERQGALAALNSINEPGADKVLESAMDCLLAGQMPIELHLDLLEAAAARKTPRLDEQLAAFEAARPKDDPLAAYRESLAGGDARRGATVFFDRADLSCRRCHKVGRRGGEVGPELTAIAAKLAEQFAPGAESQASSGEPIPSPDQRVREYLLDSIVLPSRTIAKGFETTIVTTDEGLQHAGIVTGEDEEMLRLMTADAKLIAVPKKSIEHRTTGQSAMPADLIKLLNKRDLRDLIEFLANQRPRERRNRP